MLNLPDAIQLIQLLFPYIPSNASEISVLEFSDKIVSEMVQSGAGAKYLQVVSLVSGIDVDVLVSMSIENVFHLFITGLQENELLSLIEFYKGL